MGVHILTRQNLGADGPDVTTVGAASGQVVARNPARRGLVFVNLSANRISIGIGTAAILDQGMTLTGHGATWVMDEYSFTLEAVNAIASAAGSTLAWQEFSA